VLYEIAADADAIFIGQQMDVFIESHAEAATTGENTGP